MPYWLIQGGRKLDGTIEVYGAKNAVLPILAASILVEGKTTLRYCPKLSDVSAMLEILSVMGCQHRWEGDTITVDASAADRHEMPEALSKKMRSSIFMLGPLLCRFGYAKVTYPGGCEIGLRPIDLHLKGLKDLGVEVTEKHGEIFCDGTKIHPANVILDYPSVGATENIMMAALAADGMTTIHNAAREPEVADLANFLNTIGARILGAGENTICIHGKRRFFKDREYEIMPDRIVAGTYMTAAAITQGDVVIQRAWANHLGATIAKLTEAGCVITQTKDTLHVKGPKQIHEMKQIETLPYPGFATDMQSQLFALATISDGTSIVVENVFENRYKHATDLMHMGADITIRDRTAIIRGVPYLTGTQVYAKDLRGGAALVLAGLCARGETQVYQTHYIDRGYQDLAEELNALGAEIRKVESL